MADVGEPSDHPSSHDKSFSPSSPSSPTSPSLSSSSPPMTNGNHSHPSSPLKPSPLSIPSDAAGDEAEAMAVAVKEAEEPVPPIKFSLFSTTDTSAPFLSSLSSLSSTLSSIYSDYAAQQRSNLAAYQQRLSEQETQQHSLQSSIDSLRASLAALSDERRSAESALSNLRSSVASSQSSVASVQSALDDSALRLTHLHSKAARRHQHRQRPVRLTLSTFLVQRSSSGLRRVAVPLVAVDRIFTFLPLPDVDSCARTCRLWQQVIERSRVWPLSMRRVLHNKRKKEREVEDGGEQLTRDEFDDWRHSAVDTLDVPLPAADGFDVGGEEAGAGAEVEKPVEEFVLSKAAAAALNLPPHDLPVPEHLHYALTVDVQKEQYAVSIESRRVSTLYQCAAMMDTLHPSPSSPAPAVAKTASVTLCCPLVPKSTNAAELAFCQTAIGLSEQMEVARADVERLGKQLEEDAAVKKRLQAELEEREEEVRRVQAELDMSTQQSMSDEMTRQFLEENVREVQGQVEEEETQTRALADMLKEAYRKREEEVARMERDAEGMESEVEQLREEKGRLTREVKGLQHELEDIAGDKERLKRDYEKLMDLVEQLRAL